MYSIVKNGEKIIVSLYVDDICIAGSSLVSIEWLKSELSHKFRITDLGDLNYILKLEVERDRVNRKTMITQTKYINDILKKYHSDDVSTDPIYTPEDPTIQLVPGEKLSEKDMKLNVKVFDYRGVVGSFSGYRGCG